MRTTILYTIFGILSSISAHFASDNFEKSCHHAQERGIKSFYERMASSVIYYGYIFIPLCLVIVGYCYFNIDFIFNTAYIYYFITMLMGYSIVIVFDMLSRRHVNVTTFNIIVQTQILFMLITRAAVFELQVSNIQRVGIILITGSIMTIASFSTGEKQQEGGSTNKGMCYVLGAAIGRAIAITMDSYLANRMFSYDYASNFSLPRRLYECLTFVGPATIVFLLMRILYIFQAKNSKNPVTLIHSELKDSQYKKASSWSFGEYIFGVPKLTAFPYFGPVLQGLVPIVGIIHALYLGKKFSYNILIPVGVLLCGCFILAYG